MSSLLSRFVSRTDFDSYEDFRDSFRITVPERFNFAYDVVDAYADEDPDKIALVWCNDLGEEKSLTFDDLKRQSDKGANVFRKSGIKKGDTVMLMLKGRCEFWICMVALSKLGAIAIPTSHTLKREDIVYRIRKADLKMVVSISEDGVPEEVNGACRELPDKSLVRAFVGNKGQEGWMDFRKELSEAPSHFQRPSGKEATRNEDISLVYFTSGTTGHPKMVRHDQIYPLGHILTAKYWQNVTDDGLHYTVADTGWAKCAWGKIYGQWIAGCAVFVYDFDRFDTGRMLDTMARHGVTTFCAPPTIFRFIVKGAMSKERFSHLKYVVTGGEPLNPIVYNSFLKSTGLRIMEGYGQTETVVAIANYPWMAPKPGSMGRPSPEYEVALMDNNGEECGVGIEGEIVIKTCPRRPIGLLVDHRPNVDMVKDTQCDDYYHTGDIAWMDKDGYFWFVGRTDDMIKTSGYRVGPFEVESILMTHPAVMECAVTGVANRMRGQVVKATVVPAKGYTPSEELKRELQEYVRNKTAPYKCPRIVQFVDELPKTISGKIRRVEIRDKDK
jgi:acetyl-CoA synthetase